MAGQIDSLLAGMQDSAATLAADQTSQRVDEQLSGGDEAEPGGSADAASTRLNPGEVESLASQIDALVSEVGAASDAATAPQAAPKVATAGRVETAASTQPAHRADAQHESVDDQIAASVIEDASSPTSVDLQSLDAQLAAQASVPEPVQKVAASPVAAVLPDVSAQVAKAQAEAAKAAAPAPVAVPVAAPLVVDEPVRSVGDRVKSLLMMVVNAVKSLGGLSILLSARTLEATPKLARDTMGWIGLVTVFFACCMWAVILFFRTTPVPEVYGVPSDVLEHGEPTPQGRPRPQVHKEEAGHGEADAHGGDAHAAEADSHGGGGGHGAPADAGHGGGHH